MPAPGQADPPVGKEPAIPRVRLLSASLEDWPTPGAKATLEVSEHKTVLAGRNGAGKSLLLEGIGWGTQTAIEQREPEPQFHLLSPQTFKSTWAVGDEARVVSYETTMVYTSVQGDGPKLRFERGERCLDASTGHPIWTLKDGLASLADGKQLPVPGGLSFLGFDTKRLATFEVVAAALRHFFSRVRGIESGLPRHGLRQTTEVMISNGQVNSWSPDRISQLASDLVSSWLGKDETFGEFVSLCRRVGIAENVAVTLTPFPESGQTYQIARVWFDGTNFGELSDGTLRVAEALWALLTLGDSGLLLIEEPETGIHPGLLKRLLAEIDSYAIDHQVLVSTHSMQVVNWARPEEIRLVERAGNVTTARALSPTQLARLGSYLEDEGSLGDFVYGGGVDD